MKDWKKAICASHLKAQDRFCAEKQGLDVSRERPIDERVFAGRKKGEAE